ncbi:unnamed protein product [Phytomonas sp. EM1]|nr:unnamed protein product [Phytomonas sp. EM1]|eukprot:CCW62568.1 unnamed protein product [Phytomonas sp. isolate EM1]
MQSLEGFAEKANSFYGKNKKACLAVGAVVGSYATVKTVCTFYRAFRRMRARACFRNLEPGIVHLFIYQRWSRGPNFFPQCVKVETFLRLAKIPYIVHLMDDSSLSPDGRLPFIVCDGMPLVGCDFIIQYLTTRFDISMDAHLTPQERSAGKMLQRMVETRIGNGLNRMIFVENPLCVKRVLDQSNARPLSAILLARDIRQTVLKDLSLSGYIKLDHRKHEEEFLDAVQSLEVCLRQTPFLFGVRPTSFDCSTYAWLQVARELGPHGLALSFIANSDIIVQYIDRMTYEAFRGIDTLQTSSKTQRFGDAM